METKWLFVFIIYLSCTIQDTYSVPLYHGSDNNIHTSEQTDYKLHVMQVGGFKSFEDVTNFLRSWFRRLQTEPSRDHENAHARDTRDADDDADHDADHDSDHDSHYDKVHLDIDNKTKEEEAFEEYEKEYLIQLTMNDLKTLYYNQAYVEYINSKVMRDESHRKLAPGYSSTAAPPSPLPTVPDSPDFNRVDPILEAKLNELRNLSVRDLDQIFRNVRRAVEDGVTDNSIASLCCQMAG